MMKEYWIVEYHDGTASVFTTEELAKEEVAYMQELGEVVTLSHVREIKREVLF